MFVHRNLLEPILIVALFTFGTLLNRRRGLPRRQDVELAQPTDLCLDTEKTSAVEHVRQRPGLVVSLLRRFFDTFPFLAEIWYWNLTYWIYQLLRALSAVLIASSRPIFLRAQQHALQILRLEHVLHLDIELALQRHVLAHHTWIVPYLANIYYSHICVGIVFIIYTYTFLPGPLFRRIRRTIAVDNAIALAVVTLWRCSPPRLLPAEHGFVDVLHGGLAGGKAAGAASVWTHNRFQLTIAAMPSLHFGTALFLAVCICRFSPHRALRVLAPLWPVAMLFTIIATGNHFVMDALVGAAIPFLGWRFNQAVLVFEPIQDWILTPFKNAGSADEFAPVGSVKSLVD